MARFKTVEKYDSIKKLPFKFDIRMLNSFIGYLMKKSRQINRKSLMNMYKLFALVDERIYETNPQMDARLQFIKRALDARLKHGMENEDMLINYCRSDSYNDENEEIIKNIALYTKLNYEEIVQINKIVQDRIVHAYMLQFSPQIYELAERLDAGDYNSYKEINEQMLELARDLINESRKVNVLEDYQTISLDDPDIDSALTDVFDRLKDPARILKVGIQALNQILAPGFHAKRLYMFMGLPAGFKSGILLKTARDIKKYGRDIPTKKPGKRKTVLIVTMENTVNLCRFFSNCGEPLRAYVYQTFIVI